MGKRFFMFKRVLHALFILSLLSVCLSANAALDLELTQGINAAMPIAILPGSTPLTNIIKNDLQNSGQFRVKMPSTFSSTPVNLDVWRKQRVNAVVVAKTSRLPMRRVKVSYRLISVFNNTKDQGDVLASESFTVAQKGLRTLAHHISDRIFEKLTGVRGIFSTKIAYVLVQRENGKPPRYQLVVADADGFNPQVLLSSRLPIMSPTWSPKGKQLAYVSFEKHRATIFVQNVATGKRWPVSRAPGVNGAPAFSPDGRKLAVVLTRSGNPKIYVLDLATRGLQQLTKGPSIDTEPSWSADGKTLLFTSNRGGSPQIYQYTLATKKIARLTFNGNYNARASYTPNEKDIVMMHREMGMFSIAKEDLSSGQVQVLARSGADESPSLAPNGQMILYATQYGGRGVLAVVSIDGRIKLRLPARNGSVQEPAWSPFL